MFSQDCEDTERTEKKEFALCAFKLNILKGISFIDNVQTRCEDTEREKTTLHSVSLNRLKGTSGECLDTIVRIILTGQRKEVSLLRKQIEKNTDRISFWVCLDNIVR